MQQIGRHSWWALAAVLLLPLISMTIVPFYDTSEPRYAEIARIMAETGDWITPWFDSGVPFWGKPPLSFWAQALSIKAFGLTEVAVRLPSWLCLLVSSWIMFSGLRILYGQTVALAAVLIYCTSTLVYVSSGAVLTDPFLALGTTICLIAFAVSVKGNSNAWWRYGFFFGLILGLLAKGPLAAVLSLTPILIWKITSGRSVSVTRTLPWRSGLLLTTALTLPWYVLAEIKTPGFLNYFIVGEHFLRFLDPGWVGDLYGSAHKRAYGTIWWYWLQASFPWGVIVIALLIGTLRDTPTRAAAKTVCGEPLFSYWLAAALITPCFFMFSANILWTYLLPAISGFSVLTALFFHQWHGRQHSCKRLLPIAACLVPLSVFILSIVVWMKPDLRNTERSLVYFVDQQPGPRLALFYLDKPPFSAKFYSAGRVKKTSLMALRKTKQCGEPFYLAVAKDNQSAVQEILRSDFNRFYSNKRHFLVKVSPPRHCELLVAGSNAVVRESLTLERNIE